MQLQNMTNTPIEILDIGISFEALEIKQVDHGLMRDCKVSAELFQLILNETIDVVDYGVHLEYNVALSQIFENYVLNHSRFITIQDFRNRFTSSEQTSIANSVLPIVKKILLRFYSTAYIDLEAAEVVSSVNYLADVLIIQNHRVDEILAH